MTNDDLPDPILRSVSRLPVLTPNPQRAALMRARCRAKLALRPAEKAGRLGPAAAAGFCVVYLAALAHDVLRFRGLF